MDQLEEIRKRKLAELQAAQQPTKSEQDVLGEQILQLEGMIKQIMSKEALQRYGTVKLAHPETAMNALVVLTQAMQSGRLRKVDDETLKTVLKQLSQKRETKIIRK